MDLLVSEFKLENIAPLEKTDGKYYVDLVGKIMNYGITAIDDMMLNFGEDSIFKGSTSRFSKILSDGAVICELLDQEIDNLYEHYCIDNIKKEDDSVSYEHFREFALIIYDLYRSVVSMIDLLQAYYDRNHRLSMVPGSIERCIALRIRIERIARYIPVGIQIRRRKRKTQDEEENELLVEPPLPYVPIPLVDDNKEILELSTIQFSPGLQNVIFVGNKDEIFVSDIAQSPINLADGVKIEVLTEIGLSNNQDVDAANYLAVNPVMESYITDYDNITSSNIGYLKDKVDQERVEQDQYVRMDTVSDAFFGIFRYDYQFDPGKGELSPYYNGGMEFLIEWSSYSDDLDLLDPGEVSIIIECDLNVVSSRTWKLKGLSGKLLISTRIFELIRKSSTVTLEFSVDCHLFTIISPSYYYDGTAPKMKYGCRGKNNYDAIMTIYSEWGDSLLRGALPVGISTRLGVRIKIPLLPSRYINLLNLPGVMYGGWDCGSYYEWGDMCWKHSMMYLNWKCLGLLFLSLGLGGRELFVNENSPYFCIMVEIFKMLEWDIDKYVMAAGFKIKPGIKIDNILEKNGVCFAALSAPQLSDPDALWDVLLVPTDQLLDLLLSILQRIRDGVKSRSPSNKRRIRNE